ncbi:MAG: hypothetical protein ACREA4_08950, partial [Nitrososphaera sp.]
SVQSNFVTILIRVPSKLYYKRRSVFSMTNLKDLVEGSIVGSGSDFIVVQKGKKRLLLNFPSFQLMELKSATTPYGSQID